MHTTPLPAPNEVEQLKAKNAELTAMLEQQTVSTARLLEQTAQLVALTQTQSAKLAALRADEMADELNAAEAESHSQNEYRQMANFVSLVRLMRSNQKMYFATRDKGILLMAKQAERMVDDAISKDIWFIELLRMYP